MSTYLRYARVRVHHYPWWQGRESRGKWHVTRTWTTQPQPHQAKSVEVVNLHIRAKNTASSQNFGLRSIWGGIDSVPNGVSWVSIDSVPNSVSWVSHTRCSQTTNGQEANLITYHLCGRNAYYRNACVLSYHKWVREATTDVFTMEKR